MTRKLLFALFALQGHHDDLGTYHGRVEIRLRGDRVLVTRVADYDRARFDGLKIQEIWQAEGAREGARVRVTFELKTADFLNRVDGHVRTREQFGAFKTVTNEFDLANADEDADVDGERAPWVNERKTLRSFGGSHPLLSELAMRTIFAPVMRMFARDPFVREYARREEFQSRGQYFVVDPTDFDFLRAHPDTLRVANKVIDPIALTESALRHDAYAFSLADKASIFDREMADDHLNELGLFSGAALGPDGRRAAFTANGDGALWTGMYAGAQAMRWKVTGDPVALAGFRRALRGLILLLDITGSETEFARTAHPMIAGETLSPPWRAGAAGFENVKYVEGGNNDMVKGVFFAFAWAMEVLPPGDPLLADVAKHAVRLPRLRVNRELQRFGNKFLAAGLAALATGDTRELRAFRNAYRLGTKPSNALGVNEGFYYGGIADWSGINLSMVTQVAQILVARQVRDRFGAADPASLESPIVRETQRNLMRTARTYAGARRGFLTVAAQVFARADVAAYEQMDADLEQALWILREIPATRVPHDTGFDFTWRPDWCLSAWPLRPWKFWGENTGIERYYQGAYEYPIFEGRAGTSDNHWTGAFDFRGGSSAAHRHGRVDYLLTYWMGRFGGLFGEGS